MPTPTWENRTTNNGTVIQRKENATYVAYRLPGLTDVLTAKYNHNNGVEVETSFETPLLSSLISSLDTLTVITQQEAIDQHRGKIRVRIKFHEKITEEEALEDFIIPSAIEYGLKNSFPLKSGENPFKRTDGVFLPGYAFHSFTNVHGEVWVAYLRIAQKEIFISCDDSLINWRWKKFDGIEKAAPWVMTDEEIKWLSSLDHLVNKYSKIMAGESF